MLPRPFILCTLVFLFWSGASCVRASDGLLDFSVVRPPVAQDRVIKEPTITWNVQPDLLSVERYCKGLNGFDGGGSWREGCVVWSIDSARCTLVTSQNSSHSLMGRLLLMCMMAKAEQS